VDGRIPVTRIRPSPDIAEARTGIVLVFRVQRVASTGAVAAEAVVSLFVPRDRDALGGSTLRDVLDAAVTVSAPLASASAGATLDRGLAFHDRRTHTQLERIRSMEPGASPWGLRDPLVQPGLFDRRALAQAVRERTAKEALERQRHDWIARLERDLVVDPLAVSIPIAAFVMC
jgi:hypothetical protein